MKEEVRWTRVLLEGAVIVASILLAFGVDALWDARGESTRRSAILDGLRSDFAATRTELDRVTAFHRVSRSASEDLMQLSSGGHAPDAALADSLFAAAMLGGSFDPPLGTLQSLISAGDLSLLDDPELAVQLTGFLALVADLDREQTFMREIIMEVHRYLASEEVGSEVTLSDPYWEAPWQIESDGISSLVHVPAFRSWVGQLWVIFGNTTMNHGKLDSSLRLIEAKLAGLE